MAREASSKQTPPEPRAKVAAVIGVRARDGSVFILMAEHRCQHWAGGDHDLSFFSGTPQVKTKDLPSAEEKREAKLRDELQREIVEELGWPGQHLNLKKLQQQGLCTLGCPHASSPCLSNGSGRHVQYEWHFYFIDGTSWLLNVTQSSRSTNDPVREAMQRFESLLNHPQESPRQRKELHGVSFVSLKDLLNLRGPSWTLQSGRPVWSLHGEYVAIKKSIRNEGRPTFRGYFGSFERGGGSSTPHLYGSFSPLLLDGDCQDEGEEEQGSNVELPFLEEGRGKECPFC